MSDTEIVIAARDVAVSASSTASDAADFAAEKAVEVNADRVAAQAAAAAAGAQMWVGGEAVTTATVRQAPDGSRIRSNAARTTRATFDPTEQGFWTPVLSTAGTLEQVALSATIEAGVVEHGPTTGFVFDYPTETTVGSSDVYAIGSIAGTIYGRHSTNGGLYSSPDGTTWTQIKATGAYYSIHPLGNGEVLLNATGQLYRTTGWATNPATATITQCLDANGAAYFISCSVDTYENIVIAAEYGTVYTDARYVWISTNNGVTFTQATGMDLNTMWPANTTNTHWHSVCIDPWHTGPNPRLWASHGDGPRGVYYSDDLGATWTQYASDWQPMPLMATRNGIVTSTDQNPDGVFLIPRNLGARQLLARIPAPFWSGTLLGFGLGALRDDATGIVYINFRADYQAAMGTNSVKARMFATDGIRASIIYETEQVADAVGESISFEGRPALTADGDLLTVYVDPGNVRRQVRGTPRRGSKSAFDQDPGNVLTGSTGSRNAVAIGPAAVAYNRAVIIGAAAKQSRTTDTQNVAVGPESQVADSATTVGFQAQATGANSVSMGYDARGVGIGSVAVGSASRANGTGSVAVGRSAVAGGESVAIGDGADATDIAQAVLVGRNVKATAGQGQTLVGYGITSGVTNVTAVGNVAQVTNVNGVAVGYDARSTADGAVSLGVSAYAQGTEGVAIGKGTVVPGGYAVGIGYRTLEITKFQTGNDASAPTAGKARVYVKEVTLSGSAKQQLIARFPSAATQLLASESGVRPTPTFTTAGRPAATAVETGGHYFDTTLGKPVWSDGTNWKDGAGTIV